MTESDLPLSVWVSLAEVCLHSGLPQGQGLWAQQTWVWHKPFWRRSPLTPRRAARTYTWLGNRLTEGTNKTLCAPGPMRKEQWPYKRLTQTCLWVSRSIRQGHGLVVACCRVRGTECSIVCMGPFEGGCHYLHYLHLSLFSGQTTGRERSPAHQQKIWLNSLDIFPQMWSQIIWQLYFCFSEVTLYFFHSCLFYIPTNNV